ncbi:hypothetical protein CONPUDRAFT_160358 [Coniophora puteana RWD-64-598 SS2]|uniref:Uncharacterized protein n=1 Tax=Coniophora puteana (strain RWD-64-598) TaxID=741705 RepID=R7SD50_CONPW|nr:uncharacterized protein CONPUDRAFT_160358 [Coniophora puteana RWD-64-598 SS2]EIW74101.1 hypothetical protein CONPUDRAFT_160358 [Coniophora puteana RWD-64-598 SS2]
MAQYRQRTAVIISEGEGEDDQEGEDKGGLMCDRRKTKMEMWRWQEPDIVISSDEHEHKQEVAAPSPPETVTTRNIGSVLVYDEDLRLDPRASAEKLSQTLKALHVKAATVVAQAHDLTVPADALKDALSQDDAK